MTHRAEDEVDWSDGTIDDPPDASNPRSGDSGYNSVPSLRDPPYSSTPHSGDSDNSSSPHREGGLSLFVEPHESDEYTVPNGTPLSSGMCQLMANVYQLIAISCFYPLHNTSSARSYWRTFESSPTVHAGLSALCVVSGESESIRGHLSQGVREACVRALSAQEVC